MFKFFLKNKDFMKLQIFHYITTQNQVSITELMSIFYVSRTSIRRYIKELNLHLLTNNFTDSLQINQTNTFHYYVTSITQEKIAYLYFKLGLSYLKQSPKFQLLELFFVSNTLTITDICMNLTISENFAYKLIRQLNKSIEPFSITIKKSGKAQNLSIIGTESNLRFIYLVLFVTPYQCINWPFPDISQKTLRQSYSKFDSDVFKYKSLSTQTRIDFFLAIIDKRIRLSQFVESFNDPVQDIIQILMDQKDITKDLKKFPPSFPLKPESKKEINERTYFNFFIRFIDSDCDTIKDKIKIGEQFSNLANPITIFYTNFFASFFKKYGFSLTKDQYFEFMYYAVLYHAYSLYSDFNPLDIIHITSYNHSSTVLNIQTKKKEFTDYLETYLAEDIISPTLISHFTSDIVASALATLIQINKIKVLKICVQYSKDPLGSKWIKNEIHHFFNSDSIHFVSSVQEADILISDCIEHSNTLNKFYFFENTSRNTSWVQLFSFLQEKLHELFFS